MPDKTKETKPIGEVTHFYSKLGVAIVKFGKPVKVGEEVHFRGATTDFKEKIASMQFEHQAIPGAKKGQEVGIKVKGKVRDGDQVYPAG